MLLLELDRHGISREREKQKKDTMERWAARPERAGQARARSVTARGQLLRRWGTGVITAVE